MSLPIPTVEYAEMDFDRKPDLDAIEEDEIEEHKRVDDEIYANSLMGFSAN